MKQQGIDMAREAYSSACTGPGEDKAFTAAVAKTVGTSAESWRDLAFRFKVEASIMRQAQSYCEEMADRNGEER